MFNNMKILMCLFCIRSINKGKKWISRHVAKIYNTATLRLCVQIKFTMLFWADTLFWWKFWFFRKIFCKIRVFERVKIRKYSFLDGVFPICSKSRGILWILYTKTCEYKFVDLIYYFAKSIAVRGSFIPPSNQTLMPGYEYC